MSDTNQTQTEHATTWQDIVLDLVILVAIMSAIGFSLKIIMDCFTVKTPVESLTSVIRKGDLDDRTGRDEGFLKEMAEGRKSHEKEGAGGVDFVNVTDNTGRTPLMWVAYANTIEPEEVEKTDMKRLYYLRELLKEPALKLDAQDKDGFTALHWACWSGLAGVAFELADHGLDVDQQESGGYTPLMLAAMRGNDSTVRMLLRFGADPAAVNAKGETALQLAEAHAAAYAASESSLYSVATAVSSLFESEEEQAEEKKHIKGAFFYFPIYKEGRSDSHAACVKLLQNPPAAASREELRKELAAAESKARALRLKAQEASDAPAPEKAAAEPAPAEEPASPEPAPEADGAPVS